MGTLFLTGIVLVALVGPSFAQGGFTIPRVTDLATVDGGRRDLVPPSPPPHPHWLWLRVDHGGLESSRREFLDDGVTGSLQEKPTGVAGRHRLQFTPTGTDEPVALHVHLPFEPQELFRGEVDATLRYRYHFSLAGDTRSLELESTGRDHVVMVQRAGFHPIRVSLREAPFRLQLDEDLTVTQASLMETTVRNAPEIPLPVVVELGDHVAVLWQGQRHRIETGEATVVDLELLVSQGVPPAKRTDRTEGAPFSLQLIVIVQRD